MSDKPQHTRTEVPQGSERKDANTVLAVVNTAAAVANTAATIYSAHQSGKQKPPPKDNEKA